MPAPLEKADQLDLTDARRIAARLDELERRIAALEHPAETLAEPELPSISHPLASADRPVKEIAEPATTSQPASGTGFSVVGIALLGIAGAYLLRALFAAGIMPRALVATVAGAYAVGWLLASVRTRAGEFAASLYGVTSVLILAPMLWEVSTRFQALPALGVAGLLVTYAGVASVLGFRSSHAKSFSIGYCGVALTAAALLIGTHAIAVFAVILLVLHGVCELSILGEDAPAMRVLVALCVDFGAWSLVRVYPISAGESSVYPALAPAAAIALLALLFLIQLAALILQTVRRWQPVGVARIFQLIASLALFVAGIFGEFPASARLTCGLLAMSLAIAAYLTAYGFFQRSLHCRNYFVFLAWGFILLLTGLLLLMTPTAASMVLAVLAAGTVPITRKLRTWTTEGQSVLFLFLASALSGLALYALRALAGELPGMPGLAMIVAAASAFWIYGISSDRPREEPLEQMLHLAPALLSGVIASATVARGLASLAAISFHPESFHIAVLRTLALCVTAFALVFAGGRFGRIQTVRVAYALLGLATAKLVFEDLRHGRLEFAAISIFLVALTFIGVPRAARIQKKHL